MKLYNTLTKSIEEFIPKDEKEVTMYTCGPTVYNYAHIGNLRTYIFEDVLEKTLSILGYDVKRCMNITDVGHMTNDSDDGEDKMSKSATEQNMSVYDIANFYTEAFLKDCEELNIKIPSILEKASDYVPEYIKMIVKLIELDFAYLAGGNVYFDVSKANKYYELSGKKEEDLLIAVREDVSVDSNKRNAGDFGLWFTNSKFANQLMVWDSPWGLGYPGWHIECSMIAVNHLGEYLDIHCGGVDNIFPHHTNEIAQSEAYLGHKWCNYWVHGEYLLDKTGKMSKSKGEFLTVELLKEKGYEPIVYRMFCLNSHYRKQLVFSYESLDMTVSAYKKLKNKVLDIKNNVVGEVDNNIVDDYMNKFKLHLEDDLNTANALTLLYNVVKSDINNATKLYIIDKFDMVLSLDLINEKEIDDELINYINEKIEERNIAKAEKNYIKADEIRTELEQNGIIIKDTREGTSFEVIR